MKKEQNTKRVYSNLYDLMNGADWYMFMNHGYAPFNKELESEDEKWRYQIGLYDQLVEFGIQHGVKENLKDLSLLEVGSGRGGGLSYIKRYFELKRAVGLDLMLPHTQFCQQRHSSVDNLEFIQGNAQALPFEDNAMDLVLNVESAHCYENRDLFFEEVQRVLKKDGYFLFTDITTFPLLHPNTIALLQSIKKTGLHIVSATYITENASMACKLDKEGFKSKFAFAHPDQLKFMTDLATKKEKLYRERAHEYIYIIAKK